MNAQIRGVGGNTMKIGVFDSGGRLAIALAVRKALPGRRGCVPRAAVGDETPQGAWAS